LNTPRPLRILIVEDEILIALELESLLQDAGHQVVGIGATSAEAMSLAAELRPDLALVDIHLADGPTGVDVARHLGSELGVTVLFMTANAKRIPEDRAGAKGVISKPYTERGVHQAIAYVTESERNGASRAPAERVTFIPFVAPGKDDGSSDRC
jgi:CheY-like chemotaxis protein